jgi:hypothetical protein
VRRVAIVVACLVAGVAAGAIWTWLQPDRFRAEARVLVRPPSTRIVPAVEALAESSLVESNVAQTLHLSAPPHVSATSGKGGLLTVSVSAGSRERARQIDAEVVVIVTQKVAQRFGNVGVSATVLDPAHVAAQTSPSAGRNLLITGLAGLVVGIALAAAVGRRLAPQAAPGPTDPGVERRLQGRIDQVAKRERALAQRAGRLAAREQELARREGELGRRAAALEPAAAPEQEPGPTREPEPPPPPPAPVPRPAGRWRLDALEAVTRERGAAASPEQREEWSTYLFFLRAHAEADGTLPASFDQLVNDIFGPLPSAAD